MGNSVKATDWWFESTWGVRPASHLIWPCNGPEKRASAHPAHPRMTSGSCLSKHKNHGTNFSRRKQIAPTRRRAQDVVGPSYAEPTLVRRDRRRSSATSAFLLDSRPDRNRRVLHLFIFLLHEQHCETLLLDGSRLGSIRATFHDALGDTVSFNLKLNSDSLIN